MWKEIKALVYNIGKKENIQNIPKSIITFLKEENTEHVQEDS